MDPFFITGLPRSRTAWLANLLTTDRSMCFHDLLGQVTDLRDFQSRLNGMGATFAGDSDSGLMWCYHLVEQMFPGARWVFVTRDFDSAWASLGAFAARGPWAEQIAHTPEAAAFMRAGYEAALEHVIGHPRCLVVRFDRLDHLPTVESVWRHCLPDLPFNPDRACLLQDLRVEACQERRPLTIAPALAAELTPH